MPAAGIKTQHSAAASITARPTIAAAGPRLGRGDNGEREHIAEIASTFKIGAAHTLNVGVRHVLPLLPSVSGSPFALGNATGAPPPARLSA